jgi:4-hydroxybenzoate polyprenyltransferase
MTVGSRSIRMMAILFVFNSILAADGRLTGKEAVWTFLILSWVSAALLVFLPVQVFIWSFGAVALAFIYPFMKRFTHLPQVFLAAAFGWAIPMAYVAVSQVLTGQTEVDIWCWLLFFGYMCWTVAYDTQYAMAHSRSLDY